MPLLFAVWASPVSGKAPVSGPPGCYQWWPLQSVWAANPAGSDDKGLVETFPGSDGPEKFKEKQVNYVAACAKQMRLCVNVWDSPWHWAGSCWPVRCPGCWWCAWPPLRNSAASWQCETLRVNEPRFIHSYDDFITRSLFGSEVSSSHQWYDKNGPYSSVNHFFFWVHYPFKQGF